jgi:hypothetical protein
LICRQLKTSLSVAGAGETNVSASGDFASSTAATHNITITNVYIDGVSFDTDHLIASGASSTYLLYKINALYSSSPAYYLADKIDEIIVTIGLTGTAIVIKNIAVITHSLTMRDLSIPIENWTADARYACVTSSPYYIPYFNNGADTDVTVYQFNNYGVLLDGTGNPIDTGKIQLNGHDRFDEREGPYFNYIHPYECHTHTPADGINVYSFALHPEQHQPSGSANLSRIDNTQLILTFTDPSYQTTFPSLQYFSDAELYVYDFNYNVLRVMSGMAGLAYSN